MFMARLRGLLKSSKGFTLIEIAIVVAIIGLLLMIALPLYSGARVRAYVAEARALTSEFKSLAWACLIEKSFNEVNCSDATGTKVGWPATSRNDSGPWQWNTGAVFFCKTIATVTASEPASTCASDFAAAAFGVRITHNNLTGLTSDYVIAINTSTGKVGESPADGTSFTP